MLGSLGITSARGGCASDLTNAGCDIGLCGRLRRSRSVAALRRWSGCGAATHAGLLALVRCNFAVASNWRNQPTRWQESAGLG